MGSLLFRLFFVLLILVAVDVYAFQAVRMASSKLAGTPWQKGIYIAYWVANGILYLGLFGSLLWFGGVHGGSTRILNHFLNTAVLLVVPKLVIIVFLFGEDVVRLARAAIQWAMGSSSAPPASAGPGSTGISRSVFLSQLALGVAAIPFVGTLYGITRGKYDYRVHRHTLAFKDLPEAFDGFTIVQLSDIHCGSFGSREAVLRGILKANELQPDVTLFTGDIVNDRAEELDPWMDVFSQLKAKEGVYSILGNHDYGDYVRWPNEEAKAKNLADLKARHGKMGFRLLLNEHKKLERGGQAIALVGVENWGMPPFTQYGDLDKAASGTEKVPFRVLLSHDPTHWDAQVVDHRLDFGLTLAGHTHGMQFGVEIPGFRWSPVKYRYPRWAGLYQREGKVLNVNRGFGYIGFHGRVGIWPEITHITLKRA